MAICRANTDGHSLSTSATMSAINAGSVVSASPALRLWIMRREIASVTSLASAGGQSSSSAARCDVFTPDRSILKRISVRPSHPVGIASMRLPDVLLVCSHDSAFIARRARA